MIELPPVQSLAPLNSAANPLIYCLFSTSAGQNICNFFGCCGTGGSSGRGGSGGGGRRGAGGIGGGGVLGRGRPGGCRKVIKFVMMIPEDYM